VLKKLNMRNDLQDRKPVIDLFAGPGALAEGFSAFRAEDGSGFRISLSVEKDMPWQKLF
jgi:hypothetical protein